jgi:putative transposase
MIPHHRRSIRLPVYDYRQPGAYFVTIAVFDRQPISGKLVEGVFQPNRCGDIARIFWNLIPTIFTNVILDESVIMPDHLHGIILINETNGTLAHYHQATEGKSIPKGTQNGSLGAMTPV